MAYTADAVLSKLSALNESHDSIATTAQWIMFHRRHAAQTVQLWFTKLRDSPSPKRLNMLYLANEVVQQSRARNKDDFLHAFSPIVADATSLAYKGASSDIQSKLRRVVDVWRERKIFELDVQSTMEARLDEIDRSKSHAKVAGFGGSMFGSAASSSIPSELSPLVTLQQSATKSTNASKSAINNANANYQKITDLANSSPAPTVYAAQLTGLLKTLANAEGAVTECIKARKELIKGLEKILVTNREAVETEEAQLSELSTRRTAIEERKKEIEVQIMLRLPSNIKEQSPSDRRSGTPDNEPERPQVEALTPPHVQDHDDIYDTSSATKNGGLHTNVPPALQQGLFPSAPGIEMLSHLASQYQAVPVNGSNKKRKIEASDDFPDLGGDDGIDADVAEILRKDSHA